MDMEELQVKPDAGTVERVARAYSHYGYHEVGQALLERQSVTTTAFRYVRGKRVVRRQPFRGEKLDPAVSQSSTFQLVARFKQNRLFEALDSARCLVLGTWQIPRTRIADS